MPYYFGQLGCERVPRRDKKAQEKEKAGSALHNPRTHLSAEGGSSTGRRYTNNLCEITSWPLCNAAIKIAKDQTREKKV